MDARGNIYMEDPALREVPAEDQARLDGYLRGRAEADAKAHKELVAEQAAIRDALHRREGGK